MQNSKKRDDNNKEKEENKDRQKFIEKPKKVEVEVFIQMLLFSSTRILVLFIILNMNFLSFLICVSNCVNKKNINIVKKTNKIEVKV